MDIIKRKILLEDFINRADSKFMSVDNTNVRSTTDSSGVCGGISADERKNIWGKIPQDIVLSDSGDIINDYSYSVLLNIGLNLEYMGDDYTPPTGVIAIEWDDTMYSFDNINEIYKKTEVNDNGIITKYYKLVYIDVLNLIEYSYEDDNVQSLINVLKYKTLLRYYRFLQYLRLNVTLYRKCSERFFEIKDEYITVGEGEQNIYDKFYEKFYTIEDGGIVINSEDDIDVVDTCNGDTTPFSDIGFYSEVPTDIDEVEHDIICVTKGEYANLFNTVFRQNKKRRYECVLWDLCEKVLEGDVTIRGIESHLDIPLYIEEDINSNGLFDRVSRDSQKRWITRDEDDMMYAWDIKPFWNNNSKKWGGNGKCFPVDKTLYTDITLQNSPQFVEMRCLADYNNENDVTTLNIDDSNMTVNAVKYSELIPNFQRRIVETEDGEVLPMVIKEYEVETNNKLSIKNVYEFPYLLGRVQNANTRETGLVNVLDKIKFIGTFEDGGDESSIEWVYYEKEETNDTVIKKMSGDIVREWEYTEKKENGYIKVDVKETSNGEEIKKSTYDPHMLTIGSIDNKDIVMDDNEGRNLSKGKVTFTYTLNKEIEFAKEGDKKGRLVPNTGIQHMETYDFELKEDELIYYIPNEYIPSSNEYGFKDIEYEENEDYPVPIFNAEDNGVLEKRNIGEVYKEVDNEGKTKSYKQLQIKSTYIDIKYGDGIVMSDITYEGNDINDEDIFVNDFVFKNPYLDGIEDMSIKIIDGDLLGRINIERSKSAAFERHNILCEVNTMQDLENYRNDFFKIRK